MTTSTGNQTVDVVMPQLGESVGSGVIERWLKAVGDAVAVDEPLYEVSSDKATMEVPSLAAGHLLEIVAREGEEVGVGSVIARIGAAEAVRESAPAAQRERLSPVVRRLLREGNLDPATLARPASGRIRKADVMAQLDAMRATTAPAPPASAPAPPAAPVASNGDGSRRQALSRPRLKTIERLSAAQKNAVDVFSVIEIDMETVAAERVRRGYTFLPFIARAAVNALRSHEALNASIDEETASIVFHDSVHLGFAVDLDDGGLAVPVVRHAERLTLDALAGELRRLAQGARSSKLRPDEYGGSTFTISNNGAFGTLMTAPALNPPNVAVISTDLVELRPVVVERMIAIRHRMYLCMTWDHRAFDGSTAANFLGRIKRNLETWDWNGE